MYDTKYRGIEGVLDGRTDWTGQRHWWSGKKYLWNSVGWIDWRAFGGIWWQRAVE